MSKKNPKKFKVVFITEYFPSKKTIDVRGGVEIRTYYLAKALSKKYSVVIIASKEKNKPNAQILDKIIIKRVGIKSIYGQKGKFIERIIFLFQAILECLKTNIDLLEGTGFLGQIVVLIVSKIRKVTSVAFVPDTFSNFSSSFGMLNSILLKGIEKIIFKHNWDGYIAISNEVRKKLESFNVNKDKIKVIYCGVNSSQIPKIRVNKTYYPSICSISRLVSYKHIDQILQTTSLLIKIFPKIVYFVVGDGEEYGNIRKLVDKLRINKHVKFFRFLPDHEKVLQILKSSWIYCSASQVEGFGIATIEAMVLGVPFVITDIPVNREITREKGGLFFQPGKILDLKDKIEKLIKDKDLAEKIIQNNHQVVTDYEIQKMIKSTELYYLYLSTFK